MTIKMLKLSHSVGQLSWYPELCVSNAQLMWYPEIGDAVTKLSWRHITHNLLPEPIEKIPCCKGFLWKREPTI